MKISAKVFAKINLNLKITGTRGKMHTLDSLMHSIGVFDRVTMTVGERGVYMNGEESPNNIVWKVVDKAEKAGLPPIRFDIEKGIPMEAGLGGSSADAACAMRLIEREFGLTVNPLDIGSDVRFMLDGGLARVKGVGEEIASYDPIELNLVIAKGNGGVSTALAYSEFDKLGTLNDTEIEPLVETLRNNRFDEAKKYLFNDLQAVSEIINPEVKRVLSLMKKHTPLALMSGSGSSVFGIFENEELAKRAEKELTPYVEFVRATKTVPCGVVFENQD